MAKNRTIPFGYMMKDGKITVNPKEVLAVVTILSEYLAGKSLSEIADQMTVPYSEGVRWNKNMVKRILENEKYLGTEIYPQLISKDIFKAANERKVKKATSLYFTGTGGQQSGFDTEIGKSSCDSERESSLYFPLLAYSHWIERTGV